MSRYNYQFNREKLKEAVLFIASECPPEELGNVKLHKILYFSDMINFVDEGRPLTGVQYLKQKYGPTARHLNAVIAELVTEGRLQLSERDYFGFIKKDYIAKSQIKADILSERELALLKETSEFVRGKSAREISELSHNEAWNAASFGEVIPYTTALSLVPTEIDDDDRAWAREAAINYASETGS